MITARPGTALWRWCRKVDSMKPGERLGVSLDDLWGIEGYDHNGARFTPADRILENIVGSSYTHSYTLHPDHRSVTFCRHEETGKRYSSSPDRRAPPKRKEAP